MESHNLNLQSTESELDKNTQKSSLTKIILLILWLSLVCWFAFLWRLGSTGLVDETEPLFAEAARQMTVTGDWITPYFNGDTRFDKPALIYWLMAFFYQTIGVNEWAVRLPSALAAIALVALGCYTLKIYGFASPATATQAETEKSRLQLWFSAAIGGALIALNPETIIWARTGVSDMLLSGCMGTSLMCFFLGYARENRPQSLFPNPWYLGFYILSALAVLTKGPVGIVIPGLIIGAFLLYVGKFWQVVREMKPLIGLPIFLAISVPWFVLVILKNGDNYIESFFGYHNLERFTEVVNNHRAPWYFYFVVVFVGFFPWSIHLPWAIARLRLWKPQLWRQEPRKAHLSLFAAFWFLIIFIFFTIAVTKLPSYVIPLLPASGILVGLLWSQIITSNSSQQPIFLIHAAINLLLNLILAVALFFSPQFMGSDSAMPNFPDIWAESPLYLIGTGVFAVTCCAIALLSILKSYRPAIIIANLVSFLLIIVTILIPTLTLIDQARQLPLRQLSSIVKEIKQPEEQLILIGFPKPSVVFYTHNTFQFFKRTEKAIDKLQKSDIPDDTSLLTIIESRKFEAWKTTPEKYQKIDTKGAYSLIRIKKGDLLQVQL